MKRTYISPESQVVALIAESHILTGSIDGVGIKQGETDAREGSEACSNNRIWNSNSWLNDEE